MKKKTREELYSVIRNGSAEESAQAQVELAERDDDLRAVATKSAVSAICARNLSHGLGDHIKKKALEK
ncbi:TPA: hypothetical protein DCZ46_00965 [Candidatus Campbellbacteria bacterium]|nr:MAG: hypothetical protein UR58_C0001G0173 [Candidatus Campbellbacteria bacterium GW2011_OD1_34_28]KKP75343.1 MAG: hypothetical protein UR74_C0001G0199 [Candidatus Campbellbacteria bacterium GW2011_GWD2_35_24]KKP76096.1 MAG: hypothetical protein UR75_C0001G0130 [Candidatus Campbellbacteria bacterium GW2011_GWC2_35_28]KKP77285.1 MAG: hypothetical protein UR76_C0001G0130 [Candidatus Campbellbacteria bacterium GW2011_GWC1_35_31]KKP79214.1 MAG: hypothetical protein UR79_C0001G0130 [Candidatus Cam